MSPLLGVQRIDCPVCRKSVANVRGGFANHWDAKHPTMPRPNTLQEINGLRRHWDGDLFSDSSDEFDPIGEDTGGGVPEIGVRDSGSEGGACAASVPDSSDDDFDSVTFVEKHLSGSQLPPVLPDLASLEILGMRSVQNKGWHAIPMHFDDGSVATEDECLPTDDGEDSLSVGVSTQSDGDDPGLLLGGRDSNQCDHDHEEAVGPSPRVGGDDSQLLHAMAGGRNEQDTVPLGESVVIPLNDSRLCWSLSAEQRVHLRLADLLDHIGAPRCAFDEIMKWALEAECDPNFTFADNHICRETFMKDLIKRFQPPSIIERSVVLERAVEIDVTNRSVSTQFDKCKLVLGVNPLEQIMELLGDTSTWGDPTNLNLNPDDPWAPHRVKPGEILDEPVTGRRHQHAVKTMISDDKKQFFLAQAGHCDKTGNDVMQRHNLEPFLFSFLIFKEKLRRLDKAWRVLGYISDLSQQSSAKAARERSGVEGKGRPVRNHHRVLGALLELFQNLEEKPPCLHIRIGDEVRRMEVILTLLMMIGDMKSGDTLVGKCGSHNMGSPRLHRACDCPHDKAWDASRTCKFHSSKHFQALADACTDEETGLLTMGKGPAMKARKELHRLQQHRVSNAFRFLTMGNDPHGIAGMQPGDMMHAFLKGVIEKMLDVFFSNMTDTEKEMLDDMALELAANTMQTERRHFAKFAFLHGITNRSLLTAEEEGGVVFVLTLLGVTAKGRRIMTAAVKRVVEADGREPEEGFCESFIELLEVTLCFQAWFLCGDMWAHDDEQKPKELPQKIGNCLRFPVRICPRQDGHKWFLPKIHEIMHIIHDTLMNGRITNALASPGERFLKFTAKEPSRTAQKRGEVPHLRQSLRNLRETMTIGKALRLTGTPSREAEEAAKRIGMLNDLEDDRLCKCPNGFIPGHRPHFQIELIRCKAGDSSREMAKNVHFECLRNPRHRRSPEATVPKLPWSVSRFTLRAVLGKAGVESTNGGFEQHPDPATTVCGFTECVSNHRRCRAEPGHRSLGAWHDWAMVRCEDGEGQELATGRVFSSDLCPARIMTFLSAAMPDEKGAVPDDHKTLAVIQTCLPSKHDCDSIITERWTLETREATIDGRKGRVPVHRIVELESLDERVLVFEEQREVPEVFHKSNKPPVVHVVHSRTMHWAKHWEDHVFAMDWEIDFAVPIQEGPSDDDDSSLEAEHEDSSLESKE